MSWEFLNRRKATHTSVLLLSLELATDYELGSIFKCPGPLVLREGNEVEV